MLNGLVEPAGPADKAMLIRRVTLDLTGSRPFSSSLAKTNLSTGLRHHSGSLTSEMTITGMRHIAGSFFSLAMAVLPSITGILRSMMIKSGGSARTAN